MIRRFSFFGDAFGCIQPECKNYYKKIYEFEEEKMKCPKWLLDAMAEGRPIKCLAWDFGKRNKTVGLCVGFNGYKGDSECFCIVNNYNKPDMEMKWYDFAEPYTEPEHNASRMQVMNTFSIQQTHRRCDNGNPLRRVR